MFEQTLDKWQSFLLTAVFFILLYLLIRFVLNRQTKGKTDSSIIRTIILFTIALIGMIAIVLALPMGTELKGQITSLIGIVISAILALSSATFIGNGLAGIMMRAINNFKPGDFIEVGEYFGRISERGLFHTEIQTENRDLTTLPNLFLANNPVKVTRQSGTFITGEVSLGYDVPRIKVEKILIEAAIDAGLTDPFVRITSLGDFSVVYKIHGLLLDVKTILTTKSKINAMMLDHLHKAGIEIMSPTFVGQRQVNDIEFIPKRVKAKDIAQLEKVSDNTKPESIVFDKAEEAESIEKTKQTVGDVDKKIEGFVAEQGETTDTTKKQILQQKIDALNKVKSDMEESISVKVEELEKGD